MRKIPLRAPGTSATSWRDSRSLSRLLFLSLESLIQLACVLVCRVLFERESSTSTSTSTTTTTTTTRTWTRTRKKEKLIPLPPPSELGREEVFHSSGPHPNARAESRAQCKCSLAAACSRRRRRGSRRSPRTRRRREEKTRRRRGFRRNFPRGELQQKKFPFLASASSCLGDGRI